MNIEEASQQVPDARKQSENAQKDDLLKQYYFGCGPCHPKWLQFFAKKKFFTFLACCFTCLHSGSVSGQYKSIDSLKIKCVSVSIVSDCFQSVYQVVHCAVLLLSVHNELLK